MKESSLIKNVDLFLDDKPSVYALRDRAKKSLFDYGFPTKKNENWKYTDVKEILIRDFDINQKQCDGECCCENKAENSYFIEFCFCAGALHVEDFVLPDGVNVIPLPLMLYEGEYKKYLFNAFDLEKHPFACLNGMYLEQGICIIVDKGTKVDVPLLIKYKNTKSDNIQMNIHNVVVLEKNANLSIVEEFYSKEDNSYLLNIVNEIYLKENSELNHYKIQKESKKAYHIALNALKIYEKAKYKQYYVSNGAKISRNENEINLEAKDALAEIYSAYKVSKNMLSDITTNVNHNVLETSSNQYAKAVLEDGAKAVFQGKVYIAKDAVKSVGNQLHKALYLDGDAELCCKPQLEIYADDVKCSHGASCGEIDEEQLFYLTSRGIAKDVAVKLITDAHLNEIYSLIEDEVIREKFII